MRGKKIMQPVPVAESECGYWDPGDGSCVARHHEVERAPSSELKDGAIEFRERDADLDVRVAERALAGTRPRSKSQRPCTRSIAKASLSLDVDVGLLLRAQDAELG